MSFETTATQDDKATYAYNDFGGFSGVPDTPEQAGVPGSNDTAMAIGGSVDPNTQSTIPSQESIATPVTTNKTTGGPFQFRANQGTNPAASQHTSPARPKTATAPAQAHGGNKSGLSMFSSRKRVPTQEPTLLAEKTVEGHVMANNGGRSLKPPSITATTNNNSAPTTSTLADSEATTGSTFQRVLPPPSIPPAPTGASIPSTTPKGSSNNNTTSLFMPPHNGDSFATPLTRAPGAVDKDSSMMQKTAGNETAAGISFVTPDSNLGDTTTSPQDVTMDQAYGGKGEMDNGFDDLLSLFLDDLRSSTDRQLHGAVELLDLEVDLSRAFAHTLHHYSDSLDMLDGVEDLFGDANDVLTVMQEDF